jgi:hypothetical protein
MQGRAGMAAACLEVSLHPIVHAPHLGLTKQLRPEEDLCRQLFAPAVSYALRQHDGVAPRGLDGLHGKGRSLQLPGRPAGRPAGRQAGRPAAARHRLPLPASPVLYTITCMGPRSNE